MSKGLTLVAIVVISFLFVELAWGSLRGVVSGNVLVISALVLFAASSLYGKNKNR